MFIFPISKTTRLHQVHRTWADSFVFAALVAVFPGLNFVLLDSDCPACYLVVQDLWTKTFLARFPAHLDVGIPKEPAACLAAVSVRSHSAVHTASCL